RFSLELRKFRANAKPRSLRSSDIYYSQLPVLKRGSHRENSERVEVEIAALAIHSVGRDVERPNRIRREGSLFVVLDFVGEFAFVGFEQVERIRCLPMAEDAV